MVSSGFVVSWPSGDGGIPPAVTLAAAMSKARWVCCAVPLILERGERGDSSSARCDCDRQGSVSDAEARRPQTMNRTIMDVNGGVFRTTCVLLSCCGCRVRSYVFNLEPSAPDWRCELCCCGPSSDDGGRTGHSTCIRQSGHSSCHAFSLDGNLRVNTIQHIYNSTHVYGARACDAYDGSRSRDTNELICALIHHNMFSIEVVR